MRFPSFQTISAVTYPCQGVRGDHKESELGMATGLLARLELEGRVVTGDALYCQQELSLGVLEQGGDYFRVLKDNQPGVKEAVSLLGGRALPGPPGRDGTETGGKGAGCGHRQP